MNTGKGLKDFAVVVPNIRLMTNCWFNTLMKDYCQNDGGIIDATIGGALLDKTPTNMAQNSQQFNTISNLVTS